LDLGDDGSDWDDADRQQRPSQELVEKTALARFEAPQDRDVQRLLLSEGAAALQEIFQRRDFMALAQVLDRAERILHDFRSDGCCVRFSH